jgi:hypothetical protein
MKEQKPAKSETNESTMPRPSEPVNNGAGDVAESAPPPASIRQLPVKPAPAMQHNDVPTRKTRGRLSRHTIEQLGRVLDVFYDDVRKEGVPDRFKELLRKLEERNDKGQT